ncbi:MAG: sulfurtransferase complex subunit TusB [Pseudomonadales bacterium]|nr:sulfurtransferase complex subunit TusB [Pseudomonadales bacterium]
MSSLHLAFSENGLSRCIDRLSEKDQVVLMGDAVYSQNILEHFVLQEDAEARGIEAGRAVSYDELVQLTVEHKKVVSWP